MAPSVQDLSTTDVLRELDMEPPLSMAANLFQWPFEGFPQNLPVVQKEFFS